MWPTTIIVLESYTWIVPSKSKFCFFKCLGFEKYDTDAKDLSNAYAHIKVENNQVIYYAGFGWKKSGQFETKQEWENYLNSFSELVNNPLEVSINK